MWDVGPFLPVFSTILDAIYNCNMQYIIAIFEKLQSRNCLGPNRGTIAIYALKPNPNPCSHKFDDHK